LTGDGGHEPVYPPVHSGWEISPETVRDLLQRDPARVLLIDCRTEKEWQLARIAGAVHVPMGDVAQRLHELEAREADHVIVHCHHGVRSLAVVEFLRRHGMDGVLSMAGGIDRWSREIDPSVPRY